MASPDRSKRKILKAKKTMPASCRKQIEILHKSKNVEALKTAAIGNNVSSDNQNSSVVINNKCRDSENDVSSLDSNKNSACSQKSKVSSQNSIKPLEIDLETRSQSTEEQAVCPYQKPSKPIESPRNLSTQEAKDSQNTSENCNKANVIRSCFEQQGEDCNLKSVSSQHSVLSSIVQMSNSAVINTLDKRIDKIVSHLETNSNSASHDKRQNDILILSSDNHFVPVDKIPTAVNSVIYSNCTSDSLKSEDSYRIYHSILLNGENTESTWLSSLDTDSNNSHNHKKRMFSENKENVKRLKTSEQINENFCVALEKQTALLEQVKHLIQQEIYSLHYKLFDNKLRELIERIGKMQCRNKHEAIADELFAKIAQLHRRIKKVLLSGRNCLEPNMSSSNTSFKVVNSEALKLDKNPVNSLDERKAPVNSGPSNPSEKATEKIDLSQDHDEAVSESNDDVVLISVENPNLTTPVTSNLTDTGKITSGNFNSSNAVTEVMAVEEKNLDFVIDLTKEGLSNCNTESSVSMLESYMKSVSISKETTPMAQNETQVPESFEHLPPLPAPPQSLLDLVDKVRDTLPPQKTELKVKRVLRPRGIALTWNIAKINPKCAPVESYHLFLCHENPGIKLIWKKVGEIKALPLPMACTLSQFLASNRYYFALQSKDIFGRYGPFCDIKAIPGFSDILT
ncbi:PREDICTED: activating transcription factor 7-interacting protein 2 isoform X1 [Myotis davidii]|uniref:activating transcription factor 7-interacting protein 2 isoform X1 n=1 Tax=Myotis davidii TaxID=225400 RepID=UPI0003EBBDAA|nr:PREDICTED: activating transcription factor 7-interacting protein 2 isoform X1 [Myotis davidii]XP_015427627.1 PREDICTED: activating transcription factor 7-interacting protein 2 isoform X1 [Myotis davidii]XP_015427628.1 PREDICTED: activating transcription factor 7-interacting protein 2 isoform X1 [Myotis davidii]